MSGPNSHIPVHRLPARARPVCRPEPGGRHFDRIAAIRDTHKEAS
ncbi:hypothetical protein F4561_003843 [Lipingzhangella halophila]|uniref:Uncharacterized protein n=1 Tax=Lipingzhangella halophila TaxID=1783352 RepID=A0A7W7RK44_9ACTN|nr:hypothetical protein [Lipingzhangella halophila]MBB4933023.1 hypothetical protein [Lipingzhangella halophila]